MLLHRRGFLTGLIGTIAAPAIVRAEFLMPVKTLWVPWGEIEIDDYIRPDLARQKLDLTAKALELAQRYGDGIRLDGIRIDRWKESVRATARFVTSDLAGLAKLQQDLARFPGHDTVEASVF